MNNLFSNTILRTPVYSLESYNAFLSLNEKDLITYLKEDFFFMYALYTASPSLYRALKSIDVFDEKSHHKVVLACYKYYVRMCTRCVPFGLFSGVSVIKHQRGSIDYISRGEKIKTHTRLDSDFYNLLHQFIREKVNFDLKLYPNTSLYRLGNTYRYIECGYNPGSGKRKYSLTQLESEIMLRKIIKFCNKGAGFDDILNLIVKEGYEEDEAKEYISSLMESQVLVDHLSVSSIGTSPEKKILNAFDETLHSEAFKFLSELHERILRIDTSDSNESFAETKKLEGILNDILPKNDQLYLHKEIYFEQQEHDFEKSELVKNALDHINWLGKRNNLSNPRISKFMEAYKNRYGDTVQKLTDVIDIETGIGYGKFLNVAASGDAIVEGLKNPVYNNTTSIDITEEDLFIISKIRNNPDAREIKITEKELTRFKEKSLKSKNKGATFSFMGRMYEDGQKHPYIYINRVHGNASSLIGRFTNGSKEIKSLAYEISMYENICYSGYTCVELDYIPESSMGNIVHREQFRDFRISLLGGVEQDFHIDDLLIYIENNSVVIETGKGQKILPFFSNAFNVNHSGNLPLFELLVDILNQFEATNTSYFDIKDYHTFFNHIPRISVHNTILHRESWWVTADSLQIFKESRFNEAAAREIQKKLKEAGVSLDFIIADGDNELVINCKSTIALEIFFNEIKNKKSLILYEWLPGSFQSVVKSSDGTLSYNNEFIFLKKNETKPTEKPLNSTFRKNTDIQGLMTPCSEWIYFKIIIGHKTADRFLIELYSVVKKLLKRNEIAKFFYIKYIENDFQLRIRFLITDRSRYHVVLDHFKQIINKYIRKKLVTKFSIDTYERELVRYHGAKIIDFETLFFHDSVLSIEMIRKGQSSGKPVWIYCLEYIYILLTQLLDDHVDIVQYLERMKRSYDKEFNADKFTTRSINLKYNQYKEDIYEIVLDHKFSLSLKNKHLITILSIMKELENHHDTELHFADIIHMHIMRVVKLDNKSYEYLIYSFILKAVKTKNSFLNNKN